jgi:8-oxo-dGTP diphosphatase
MNELKHFTVRVYGLIINPLKEILLSEEYQNDQYMTKFPGGGLEFGEGPEDCILREIKEEIGLETVIVRHYYTTGFFQKALFFDDHQLISIYYLLACKDDIHQILSGKRDILLQELNGSQIFRWEAIASLKESTLSFPIDRHVLSMLKQDYMEGKLE